MVANFPYNQTKGQNKLSTNTSVQSKNTYPAKHLKVLVFCNTTSTGSLSILYDKKSDTYSGFLFKLWEYIARIENFECEYVPLEGKLRTKKGKTYDEAVKIFSKSKYDVCIGDFSATAGRAKIVKFTRSVMLSKPVLVYRKAGTSILEVISRFIKTFFLTIGFPILVLLTLAGILGYFLHKSDTKRRNLHISIWGTIGAFLQEPGMTVEKTNPKNIRGVIISFLILLAAFYFAIYLQARATAAEINKGKIYDPFQKGIKGKRIIASAGGSFVELVKSQGGIPVPISGTQTEIIQKWKTKYTSIPGLVTNDSYYFLHNLEDQNIYLSSYQIPYDQVCFLVPHKSISILNKINHGILIAHDNKMSSKLCKMYWTSYPAICRI